MTPTNPLLHNRAILTAEEHKMLATFVEQQTQLPFEMVAKLTGLPAELLRKLVRDGVLRGDAPWQAKTLAGYCDIDQARQIAAQLEAARRCVEGKGILATEAAEKYGFSAETIYNWHNNGWVRVVEAPGERNRRFNEGDIAFARAVADLTGKNQNIFPPKPGSGRPKKS